MQIHLDRSLIDENIEFIAHDLGININHQIPSEPYLKYDEKGLSFIKDPHNPREFIHIDYLKGKAGWRLNRSNHESSLKKALGKNQNRLHIFDATGGLLLDTMIFLSLGHKVTAIEQSKILFYLVKDALTDAKDLEGSMNGATAKIWRDITTDTGGDGGRPVPEWLQQPKTAGGNQDSNQDRESDDTNGSETKASTTE